MLPETTGTERAEMSDITRQIQDVLDEIRPALQADGGDVEFIDYNDGIVHVRMQGACGSCPMSLMTLKQGIESRMKSRIPEVQSVEQI